ncbi:hypothetical protein [Paenibacillus sp. Root444D2]|uniref:hypothetical protein n=1 Tax=Paenibacillus sp. Root444D2 TaxID=1736538 RepID=UPI0012E3369B|nr:hypothetical protein [Paenibacillus sp. Root444D2]
MNERMFVCLFVCLFICMGVWVGCICMYGSMDGCMDAWMDRWTGTNARFVDVAESATIQPRSAAHLLVVA